MGRGSRVCLSPIQPKSEMPKEGCPRDCNNNSSMPCMANTALVCSTPPASGSHIHPPPDNHRSLERTTWSRAPSGEKQNPFACRLEGIRQDLQAKVLSGQASSIVLAAQRTSTQNQYKACWAKWVGWCDKQQADPIQPNIMKVVDFLSDRFQAGLHYSTLNNYRSAISSTILQVDAFPVGQHSLVCKFMKGVIIHAPSTKVLLHLGCCFGDQVFGRSWGRPPNQSSDKEVCYAFSPFWLKETI